MESRGRAGQDRLSGEASEADTTGLALLSASSHILPWQQPGRQGRPRAAPWAEGDQFPSADMC